MYFFYGLIVVIVIIALIRVQKASGDIPNEEELPQVPVTKRKTKKTEYFWTYSGDGGGSDSGGFDGGASHGGDGSSTHF